MMNTPLVLSRFNIAMRALFLLIVCLIALLIMREARGSDMESLRQTEIKFDQHWERYLLAEYGCPVLTGDALQVTLKPVDCTEPPRIMADEKKQARDLAKIVFGLVDPPTAHR